MDRYKVLKRIGVGTYGSAYLVCLKKDTNQQYVLKKIKLDDANEKERVQAETEVTVLAQLDHPLVLGYVDHFMYKGHMCIVTDYCESGDLYQWLRSRSGGKSPMMEGQILELLVQILLAIQYVHSRNILHRDLKTQNIFLTKEGNIKLGDFGISRPLNSTLDLASTLIGTPYYMSPEVMSSMPYDFKSDMWSLGCCLYEMMSGKHAFDATDMSSLVLKIMRGEHLPIPSHFSPDLRDLAKSLLSKNPKQRPSTEQCLKLPFLKEYVSRAREKVAWLEQQKGREGRSRSNSTHLPRPAPSTGLDSSSDLDRELEAAKERLRRIQAERDALREQVVQQQASTSPPKRGSAILPPPAPQRVTSWREKEEYMQRLGNQATGRVMAAGGEDKMAPRKVSSHLTEDVGTALERHRELRHQRNTLRDDSPSSSGVSSGGRPGSSGGPAPGLDDAALAAMDPRARKEARRQEEIRRREAELLEARKAYFEERKTAEAKKYALYHGSTSLGPPGGKASRPRAASMEGEAFLLNGGPSSGGAKPSRISYAGGGGLPYNELNGLSLMDSSEDDMDSGQFAGQYNHHSHHGSHVHADPAAMQQFEQELSVQEAEKGGAHAPLLQTYSAGGALADRVAALRGYCASNLGQALFELIYNALRKRGSSGSGDEALFRQELMNRLGPGRMQYVHLVDQLIYFEDSAGYMR
mmetsp:Transcript_17043/g.36817  ORF Transcript_17043/g.36817 Transcript_17043/m.36817 type:complete len:694 (-) Transcript_17043:512-2593(-)|eukprot:CAMPEP_0202897744 /NCGR_PEP_ID=MMETSP1392-20130828/6436_1 /ASSEMBLY_ACC=CAM_ASM_000868 /TAXON_ID=225041 /ORGANISM="Chlamydomonas chlamydogama, Strain SAG 11-48b" /LENGTH=693 /DNA_ID=CAMNT_0049583479 /DNA_START=255 /DNA_END=2336 /DNA_ORIENTATION=-